MNFTQYMFHKINYNNKFFITNMNIKGFIIRFNSKKFFNVFSYYLENRNAVSLLTEYISNYLTLSKTQQVFK